MEAKDTVMSEEELDSYVDLSDGYYNTEAADCVTKAVEAQAEISFKAGQENKEAELVPKFRDEIDIARKSGYDEGQEDIKKNIIVKTRQSGSQGIAMIAYENYKAGMKEVVAFMEVHGYKSFKYLSINREVWQAFLKEKGIESLTSNETGN